MLLLTNSFLANCLANSSLDIISLSYWHCAWILHKLIEDLPYFGLISLLWLLCILLHSKSKSRYALPLKVSPLWFFPFSLSWQICGDWCCSSEKKTDCIECWWCAGLLIKFLFLPQFRKLVRSVIFGTKFCHAWSMPRSVLLCKIWETAFSEPVWLLR